MAERTGSRLKRGDVGRRHLFAASQTVNFPGTSDCPASNTQSEIALLPVLPSFLPSFLASVRSAFFLANHVSSNSKGGGGGRGVAETKQIALHRPALSFFRAAATVAA